MSPQLHLFGTPTLEYGDDHLALPFERRGQLWAYLALKRGWVVPSPCVVGAGNAGATHRCAQFVRTKGRP